ncbi:MAG: hypothetical protein COV30_02060 [Candidatus Yanofskybacteria bacterium CG10_big_fil_rev_8_21_14_0_10_37_15]|uniref:Uncharacterized protein n=1 Tax=Candidatus Yanofskybacteria bacterium CG10_big_fil_rev_8_21_14_0_10_37_15 TaxID=1975097 RepID=A0A2H0R5C6_9BACT|nr:MAG: hypothetical protein COV30_02060 [Candidatus Yanofskybacteria bacterium CG10_big_fil_rev_8_21_14_0_10_37_15]
MINVQNIKLTDDNEIKDTHDQKLDNEEDRTIDTQDYEEDTDDTTPSEAERLIEKEGVFKEDTHDSSL